MIEAKTYTLTLTEDCARFVLVALNELSAPHRISGPVIADIQQQLLAQGAFTPPESLSEADKDKS